MKLRSKPQGAGRAGRRHLNSLLYTAGALALLLFYAWRSRDAQCSQPVEAGRPAACMLPTAAMNFTALAGNNPDYGSIFNASRALDLVLHQPPNCSWPGRGSGPSDMLIPPIMHHVHLPNADKLVEAATGPDSSFHLEWALSCRKMYPNFLHLYWDFEASRKLVELHYPRFLPVFDSLPWDMQKADSIRYMIMHRFGGIYLDFDVICYRPAVDMFAGYDIVMQGTPDPEYLSSAVLASAPDHPLWMHVLEVLVKRYEAFDLGERSGHVLDLTGPFMLRDALKEHLFRDASDSLNARVSGGLLTDSSTATPSVIRIHEMGTFFAPCFWWDEECHKRVAKQQRLGTMPPDLAGYHLYRGSWWGQGNGNKNSADSIES